MLHDDWELNGDGSGDIEALMLNPAKKIIKCCNNFGVKYTLFAEYGQQLSMEAAEDSVLKESSMAWKDFLKCAVTSGHDVQLHFHPQWIGSVYRNGRWHLDLKKVSIALLNYSEIKAWLLKGKRYLENLLRPVKPSFCVLAYRGGGWMVQPSQNLIRALLEIGIIADCTVIKGLNTGNSQFGAVDFRHAPSALIPWYANGHDMAKINDTSSGLICIPTFAQTVFLPWPLAEILMNPGSLFWGMKRNFYFFKKRRKYQPIAYLQKPNIPFEKSVTFEFFNRIFNQRVIKLDFGVYHYRTILKMVNKILQLLKKQNISNAPLILYSHSKDFYSLDNFKRLLEELTAIPKIRFATTQEVVEDIHKNLILSKDKLQQEPK
jgi:hypothetical protein